MNLIAYPTQVLEQSIREYATTRFLSGFIKYPKILTFIVVLKALLGLGCKSQGTEFDTYPNIVAQKNPCCF